MSERQKRLLLVPTLVLCITIALVAAINLLQPAKQTPPPVPDAGQVQGKPLVLAFTEEYTEQRLSAVLHELADSIHVISPHWIRFDANGKLTTKRGSSLFVATARQADIAVWPLVAYAGPYGSRAGCPAVLCANDVRSNFVAELAQWAATLDIGGLVLDVENVSAVASSDLVTLTQQLTAAMHAQQRQLWVAVFPQIEFSPTLSNLHDIAALGTIADGVIIMTYDQHSPSTAPGPIAAFDWVERNVADIVQRVPAQKVLLGLAGYGYQWRKQGTGWRTSVVATKDMEQNHRGEPHFATADTEAWWESTQHAVAKTTLVQQYGLRGVAVWRQGLANSALWPALKKALTTR